MVRSSNVCYLGMQSPAGHVAVLRHRHLGVPQVVGADPRRQRRRRRSGWRATCGRVRRHVGHTQGIADHAPVPAEVVGSRSVPAVDGKITGCSPRYGSVRRGGEHVDSEPRQRQRPRPGRCLGLTDRTKPLPVTRTTFPVTLIVAASGHSRPSAAQQLRAPQPGRDQHGDRVHEVVLLAELRRTQLGQQLAQLVAGKRPSTLRLALRHDRRDVAHRVRPEYCRHHRQLRPPRRIARAWRAIPAP